MLLGSLAAYLVLLLFLGFVAFRRGQSTPEDYFLARRTLGKFTLIATLFATWMSTFAFLGSPGFYFSRGLSWYIAHGLLVVASPLLLLFVGRRIAQLGAESGAITPGDLLRWWFDSRVVAVAVGLICILALVPYATIQLLGIAKVLEVGTDGLLPFHVTVLGSAVIIATYAVLGGVRAIVWTDVLQGLLFGCVMILGGVAVCVAAANQGVTLSQALGEHPSGFRIDQGQGGSVMTLAMIWTFGYVLMPHMWQRMLMARDAKTLTATVPWSSCLALLVIVLPSLLIGLFGPTLLGTIDDSDTVVPVLWQNYLSPVYWVLGLAAFAAAMSTMDSQMLTAASVLQRDILGSRQKAPHPWMLRGTVAVLTITFAALALTPQVSKNIILLASKGTGIAFLLGPPALFLVLGWRCRAWAVVLGLGAGLLLVALGDVVSIIPAVPWGVGYPVVGSIAVLLVMFLGRYRSE